MNNQNDFVLSLLSRIDAIAGAEKITKSVLSTLSRDLLIYLVREDSNDIAMVNRLLNVLTPTNRKLACLFFGHFLPFVQVDTGQFAGKVKGEKKLAKIREAAEEFLANEYNDIWTWVANNVKKQKEIDYGKRVTDAIAKALNEEKGGLSQHEVLTAVMAGGITVDGLIAMLEAMEEKQAA